MAENNISLATFGETEGLRDLFGGDVTFVDNANISSSTTTSAAISSDSSDILFEEAKKLAIENSIPLLIYNIDDPVLCAKRLGVSLRIPHLLVYFPTLTTEGTIYPLGYSNQPFKESGTGSGVTTLVNASGEMPTEAERSSNGFSVKLCKPILQDQVHAAVAKGPVRADPLSEELPDWVRHVKWNLPGGTSAKVGEHGKQTISIYLTWVVEMFGVTDTENNKYVRITTRGAGSSPGTMLSDNRTNRGYFQEAVRVAMSAEEDLSFSLFSHSPENANNAETISSNTSFDLSKDGIKAGVNNSVSMTITDFRVTNKTIPYKACWDFSLNKVKTQLKNRLYDGNIDTIFDMYPMWGASAVCSLPTLAKAALEPNCQSLWTAGYDDKSIRELLLEGELYTYHAWIDTGWDIDFKWNSCTIFQTDHLVVDLSKV